MERINVEVSAELADAMRHSVDQGEYVSTEQIVRDVLTDWVACREVSDGERDRLRRLIEASDNSGPGIPAEEAFVQVRERVSRRLRQRGDDTATVQARL